MKIVVAFRQSKLSIKLIEKAVEHAKKLRATVFLITSVQQLAAQRDSKNVEEARNALDRARKVIEREGVPCETRLVFPGVSAGEEVIAFANEINADEIIVGVENKSKVGKFLMGSTAQDIILGAQCSVVTVKM